MRKAIAALVTLVLALSLAAGCASAKEPEPTATQPTSGLSNPILQDLGTLEVDVADAPPVVPADQILVTMNNIEVRQSTGGWVSIATSTVPVDLKSVLEIDQFLTSQTIPTGTYNQIRFDVASVSVLVNGQTYNATVPSGKIRLVGKFDVTNDKTTIVVLDYDANSSLIQTGNNSYTFKPVIQFLTPKANQVLGITTPSLSNNVVGVVEVDRVSASGGKKPYTFAVTAGTLPPGVTLNSSSGVLNGKPTQAGTFDFTVQVTDSSTPAQTDSADFEIRIAPSNGMIIVTTSLPQGMVGEPYTATLSAIFGNTPYEWTITGGSLPPGMDFDGVNGTINGVPTQAGYFTFTIHLQDASNPPLTDSQVLSITVLAATP